MNSRGAGGAQEIYSGVNQMSKVKTKDNNKIKKVFSSKISTNSGYRLQFFTKC